VQAFICDAGFVVGEKVLTQKCVIPFQRWSVINAIVRTKAPSERVPCEFEFQMWDKENENDLTSGKHKSYIQNSSSFFSKLSSFSFTADFFISIRFRSFLYYQNIRWHISINLTKQVIIVVYWSLVVCLKNQRIIIEMNYNPKTRLTQNYSLR